MAIVVPAQYAGQTIQCGNCRQPVVVPSLTTVPSPPVASNAGHASPEESNPLAMTGFVLSLVSFCAIALAPVALMISIMGLRKRHNHGVAVAGVIIGAFQTFSLVIGLIWLFAFGGFAIWTGSKAINVVEGVVDHAKTLAYREQTKVIITTAAATIDDQTIATGRLPDEVEGMERIKHHRDAWGAPLRYTINATESVTYSIESVGPDGEPATADDFGMSFPTLAPSDVPEALALLTDESEHRQQAGLQWLSEAEPSEADRGRVIDAIIGLLAKESLSAMNRRALAHWMNEAELPRLIAALEPSDNKVEPAAVVDVLAELKSEEGLLLLLNHPDTRVRNETDRALGELGIDDERIVRRCLADLDSHERQRQAIARLKGMSIDGALKSESAERTFRALLNMRILSGNIEDAVQFAVACDEASVNRRTIHTFVMLMGQPGADSARARDVLIALGPMAESDVLVALNSPDHSTRMQACRVLEEIGTERSLPALQELTEDRFLGRLAQSAIESIETAKREAASPSQE